MSKPGPITDLEGQLKQWLNNNADLPPVDKIRMRQRASKAVELRPDGPVDGKMLELLKVIVEMDDLEVRSEALRKKAISIIMKGKHYG